MSIQTVTKHYTYMMYESLNIYEVLNWSPIGYTRSSSAESLPDKIHSCSQTSWWAYNCGQTHLSLYLSNWAFLLQTSSLFLVTTPSAGKADERGRVAGGEGGRMETGQLTKTHAVWSFYLTCTQT